MPVKSICLNLRRISIFFRVLSLVGLLLFLANAVSGMDQPQQNERPLVVFIDPGHGGHNTGARGSENLLEKDAAMKFSGILAERLKTRYKVIMSRTDDYDLSLEDRVAKSNYARADLFISIHTGGSTLHNLSGMALYYYEPPAILVFDPETILHTAGTPKHLEIWDQVKPEQIEKSKYFAELLKMRLLETHRNLKISVSGAPLMVATGANMPVMLMEIGYVTNPGDAESLNNTEILAGYAESILKAVDDFFSDRLHL